MRIAPDAAAYLERLDEVLPRPLHELGVEFGRQLSMSGSAPAGPGLWHVEDIEIGVVADDVRSSGARAPLLRGRVYRPAPEPGLPVLVYLHGGGWSIGSLDGVDAACRVLADHSGAVVLSVDYRQAPEHPFPAPLEDCWRAVRWVGEGGLTGVDADRIAVGGDSAGANLAAVCVQLARDTGAVRVAGQLLIYPPTDAEDDSPSMTSCADAPVLTTADVRWFWDLYVPASVDRSDPAISPRRAGSLVGLPPTAVFTAEYDPIRDDGETYAGLLAEAGVSVLQRRVDGVYHGFFPLVGLLSAADTTAAEAATWLRRTLSA